MRKVLVFSLIVFLGNVVNAADYAFKVLASNGSNKVKRAGNWESLYTGDKLKSGQKIKLTKGGYLGLIHKEGQTVELKKEGEYSVGELSKKVEGKQSGFTEKYASFVADKMAKEENEASLKVTGSVERTADDASIRVFSPEKGKVLPQPIMLQWRPVKGVEEYQVTVSNMYEEPVLSKKTTSSNIKIDLAEVKEAVQKAKKSVALVTVKAKDDASLKSREYALQFVSDEKAKKMEKKLKKVKGDLSEPYTALDQLLLGAFYERNGLYLNALTHYKRASEMEPGVKDYEKAYAQFIKRRDY